MTREVMFTSGPIFFRDNGNTMFAYQVDASNMIGPRPATDADYQKYPAAWEEFVSIDGTPLTDLSTIQWSPPEPAKRRPGRPKKAA